MILTDATPLQSEHRVRGVGAYLRYLIRSLEQLGEIRPHYLVSRLESGHVKGQLPAERTVEVFRPHRPAQVYWFYNEVVLRAALYRLRPNVFFAPDFNGLVRNPFGKTVATLYDLTAYKLALDPSAPRDLSTRLSDLRWRAYYRKLVHADHLIAISHAAKRDAHELLGIPEERITPVHLGIDHRLFVPSRRRGAYADQPPYIVHIGGRNENKNQLRVLEAFSRVAADHPTVQLFFAGPWRPPDLAWLEAARARLGLGARARHLGYVAEAELPSLYSNALVLVFPSLEEGFGFPVLEAMACGTPVITSERSSMPEIAAGAALLVDPSEVASISTALGRLLTDERERARLRTLGLERARSFTWEATARGTAQALLEQLGTPAKAR